MAPTQLPGHLDVARLAKAQMVLVVAEDIARPREIRLEVAVPVDALAKMGRSGTEQVDDVRQRCLRLSLVTLRELGIRRRQRRRSLPSDARLHEDTLYEPVESGLGWCAAKGAQQRRI